MSGIYIHIPFCKKACHYCNFHFSTQIHQLDDLVESLLKEITLQKNYLSAPIETIYFGGGTPSLLQPTHFEKILNGLQNNFDLTALKELTIEANPDDINLAQAKMWKSIGINRLSIGIQSFQAEALSWMNRAHDTKQSRLAIEHSKAAGIDNISADLIYGTPNLSDEALLNDIAILNDYEIPHLSCYALTVEEKTALFHLIQEKKMENVDTEKQARHFELIVESLSNLGYEHYEISNFAKPGQRSRHNSNYWKGIPYLGLGPSAHSYNNISRQWNIANNALYMKSIKEGIVPYEVEQLDLSTKYNEFMMISLRLLEGVDMQQIETRFGLAYKQHTHSILADYLLNGKIELTEKGFTISKQARFLADGIASDFFIV
jgi:oxygen-independent coproporphyrinogen III oxidase